MRGRTYAHGSASDGEPCKHSTEHRASTERARLTTVRRYTSPPASQRVLAMRRPTALPLEAEPDPVRVETPTHMVQPPHWNEQAKRESACRHEA